MSTETHLDRETLQTLQEVMEDQFPVLISTFISDSEERIRSLRKALATQDGEAVRRQSHSFKGSCNNLGALRLGELCQIMETRGRQNDLEGLECYLVDIQQEFSQLRGVLKSFTD